MRRTTYLAIASLALSGACYHATVETGMASNGQVIDKAWANGFIYGLVPPDVVETAAKCPSGIAKVETEHSFLNSLVGGLTFGIYTPMHIKVTCGTGRRAELPTVKSEGDLGAAMSKAAELSLTNETPVLVLTR
jgi:hypothetical protein